MKLPKRKKWTIGLGKNGVIYPMGALFTIQGEQTAERAMKHYLRNVDPGLANFADSNNAVVCIKEAKRIGGVYIV